MNITQRDLIMQRWGVVQRELMPDLGSEIGPLTSKLEKVIHTLVSEPPRQIDDLGLRPSRNRRARRSNHTQPQHCSLKTRSP